MFALQVSDNTHGIKADLKRGQGGVPGALTLTPPSRGVQSGERSPVPEMEVVGAGGYSC